MRDQYFLHTHHHLLVQREADPKSYLHKSKLAFDNLKEACRALFFYDQRMYFRDIAWDHGFFSHIVSQQLVSANRGLLFQQYAIDKSATADLPAGLYLYANLKTDSLKKLDRQTGYDLRGFEKKGPNGELLLLATKRAIGEPDNTDTLFVRRALKRNHIIEPPLRKGMSR